MPTVKREPSPSVLATWRSAKAVCFDVDSTLCVDESIDEIAAFLGVGEQVAALTSLLSFCFFNFLFVFLVSPQLVLALVAMSSFSFFLSLTKEASKFEKQKTLSSRAMGGSTKFEDALAARLGLMKPSRAQIEEFIAKNPPKLSPGIPELVQELQDRGTKVFLVSGGFRAVIEPIADSLNIPRSHVFANSILFDAETGEYAGFDPKEHTSRSGGKLAAVQAIRKEHQGPSDAKFPIVAVGDGATDAEAVSADGSGADVFIGYGGVVERQAVAERADWFVKSIQELRDALKDGEKKGGENGVA